MYQALAQLAVRFVHILPRRELLTHRPCPVCIPVFSHLQGIAPTLIIVRMGLGLKPHDEAVFSTPQWDSSSSANPRSQQSVLAIEIRQEVDVENEGADAAGRDQRFTLANTRGKIPGKPSGL